VLARPERWEGTLWERTAYGRIPEVPKKPNRIHRSLHHGLPVQDESRFPDPVYHGQKTTGINIDP